ncbi:MAG: LysM peptidoglycan-binding domain-containing protein [Parachlamydiaceae bacterium]|nr:LysM peptidoglycan-binding domain-containing protein [Parachlamydiaceae bacterium]
MTRRDIIIVAVLVNAGLLAILFMMAITTDEDRINEPTDITAALVEEVQPIDSFSKPSSALVASSSHTSNPADEVDLAIKAFTEPSSSQPVIVEDDNGLDLDDQDDEPAEVPAEPVKTPKEVKPTPKAAKPTATASSATSSGKNVEVTVKRGDSLDKIARANGTTIKAIKEANQLKTDRLDIGKVLKIPVSTEKAEKKASTTTSTTSSKPAAAPKATAKADKAVVADSDAQYYTIKTGDNPWKIAKQFQIKVDDFLKLNNLDETKARNLKVGDKVRVR